MRRIPNVPGTCSRRAGIVCLLCAVQEKRKAPEHDAPADASSLTATETPGRPARLSGQTERRRIVARKLLEGPRWSLCQVSYHGGDVRGDVLAVEPIEGDQGVREPHGCAGIEQGLSIDLDGWVEVGHPLAQGFRQL